MYLSAENSGSGGGGGVWVGAVRRSRKQKAKANRTPIPQLPPLDCHPHLLIFSSTRRLPSGDGRRPARRHPPLPSSSFTSLPPERPPAKPRGRKDCGGGVSGFILLTAKGPGGGGLLGDGRRKTDPHRPAGPSGEVVGGWVVRWGGGVWWGWRRRRLHLWIDTGSATSPSLPLVTIRYGCLRAVMDLLWLSMGVLVWVM